MALDMLCLESEVLKGNVFICKCKCLCVHYAHSHLPVCIALTLPCPLHMILKGTLKAFKSMLSLGDILRSPIYDLTEGPKGKSTACKYKTSSKQSSPK